MNNLSVITINYNNLAGLLKTYHSIQLYLKLDTIQWVVIDGNSTDGSVEFLNTLQLDTNHIIISENDLGIYDAMNKGVLNSNGSYLIFLNSGDVLCPDIKINKVLEYLNYDSDLVLFGFKYNGKSRFSRQAWWIYWSLPTSHQSIIYKRWIFVNNKYDLKYRYASDYDHFFRLWKIGVKITQVPLVLTENETYGSDLNISIVQKEYLQILKNHLFPFLAVLINKMKFNYINYKISK